MQQPPRNADMGARSSRLHSELARPAVGRGSNGSRQQRTHQTYQAVRRRSTPPLYQDLLLQAWPSGFTMPDVASLCVHSGSRDFGDNTCYVLRCLGAVYSITTFIRALTC